MNAVRLSFAKWLSERLPDLRVHLKVRRSHKVSKAIDEVLIGIESVLSVYRWQASWVARNGRIWPSEDWDSTKSSLGALQADLQSALSPDIGDDQIALEACLRIVRWGGNRRSDVGAIPFLAGKAAAGQLSEYLRHTRSLFRLADFNFERLRGVELMNSMLTKVHAFAASDGLPIYDSRVAAAIAALAELYRREVRALADLPEEMRFPAVGGESRKRVGRSFGARDVRSLFADARSPGVLRYSAAGSTLLWSTAIVRLGRLMIEVLALNDALFRTEGNTARRMRAFEASLFMIGYDLAALNPMVDRA